MPEQDHVTPDPGLIAFTKHYDSRLDSFGVRLGAMETKLSGEMGEIRALLTSALKNQDGVFNRLNRPWQWGVVVAVFMGLFSMSAMFGTILTLALSPMKDSIYQVQAVHQLDVERNLALHMWFRETIADMQVSDAATREDVNWLIKMEERLNSRLHGKLGERKP